MARILIQGAYGGFNLGDELILHRVKGELLERGHEVLATSGKPEHTRKYHDIEAVPWVEPHRLRTETLKIIDSFDAVVLGGGEQFMEGDIPNPFWGLLAQAAYISAGARRASKPIFLWSVGVPDGISVIGNWMIRRWLAPSAFGTVRDERSRQRLLGEGFNPSRIDVAPDPVFLLPRVEARTARAYLEEIIGGDAGDRPIIMFVPHRNKISTTEYLHKSLPALRSAAERHGAIIGVQFMGIHNQHDLTLLEHPSMQPDSILRHIPVRDYAPEQLACIFGGADLVVSTRMHPLIVAMTQGTPFINIARSSKMEAFGEHVEIPNQLHTDDVDAQLLSRMLDEVFLVSRDEWSEKTATTLKVLQEQARHTAEMFDSGLT